MKPWTVSGTVSLESRPNVEWTGTRGWPWLLVKELGHDSQGNRKSWEVSDSQAGAWKASSCCSGGWEWWVETRGKASTSVEERRTLKEQGALLVEDNITLGQCLPIWTIWDNKLPGHLLTSSLLISQWCSLHHKESLFGESPSSNPL